MANVKSYNQIIDFINDFADSHIQIKRFDEGFRADLNDFAKEDNNFPLLYAEPINQVITNQIQRYRIRLYCLDLLAIDKSNRRDILSDTLQIMNDFYNHVKNELSYDYNISNSPTCIPVQNITIEGIGGWQTEFEIEVVANQQGCDIPKNIII
jgi:hypothetical protein